MRNKENTKIKKERRIKFNAIDAVIILVLLVCAAGIYARYNLGEVFSQDNKMREVEISFLTKDLRYTSMDYFNEGDRVFMQGTEKLIGTFASGFTVMPAEYFHRSNKGYISRAYYPENTRIDVRGKILTEGTFTDGGFYIDGKIYLAPGSELGIQTRNITVVVTVTGISELGGEYS